MAKAKTFNPDDYIKPGVHSTGEPNLYLLISTVGNNARSWTFRYYREGKTNVLGLGPLHTVTFNEAKVKALELRRWLLEGKDPKIELSKRKLAAVAKLTFDQCVTQYIAAKTPEWSNPKHIKQWSATLATYASPVIGAMPVDQVETSHLLKILNPIWATKTETATRVRQRIEAVLAYAKSLKLRDGDNPAAWEDHLKNLLALPSTLKKLSITLPYRGNKRQPSSPPYASAKGKQQRQLSCLSYAPTAALRFAALSGRSSTLRQKLGPSRANV